MTMNRVPQRAGAWVVGLALVTTYGDSPGFAQTPLRLTSLASVYQVGALIEDRNGDDLADFVAASLVLSANPSSDEVAAASDVSLRLGYETMAMDLPVRRDAGEGAVIAIGRGGLTRAGVSEAAIDDGDLAPGQGLITIADAGTRPVIALLGGDGLGLRAAATGFAGRLPYLWDLKDDTLETVAADVRRALSFEAAPEAAVDVVSIYVKAGDDTFDRVVARVRVPAAERVRARAALSALRPSGRETPQTDAGGPTLSYDGARTVDVVLQSDGLPPARVSLARLEGVAPPEPRLGRRPGVGPKDALDLSSLYSIDGLLGDSDGNLIPDRVDAVISAEGAGSEGVIDVAARLGLESTGATFPLSIPSSALGDPASQPSLVLVGASHPAIVELEAKKAIAPSSLAAGEGFIQVVKKAFGERSAVVVTGGDAAGLMRATAQVAERLPHIWERGKDRTTLDDVENDLRRFIAGRSAAGQAAAALYKLDRLAASLGERPLESAHVRVYVEKAEDGLDAVVRSRLQGILKAQRLEVTVEDLDVQRAAPIVDEQIEIPSEVDDFWRALRLEVIPSIRRRQPIVVHARLSEPAEVRRRLEQEATAALIKAGARAEGTSVTVLSAYKQGYSWLYDQVRPALEGKPVQQITIRFAEIGPPAEWPHQAMYTPTRWLLELYPIDEVLARDLGLDVKQVQFEKGPIGAPTYEVIATGSGGEELFRQQFEPKVVLRNYFDRFPDYEKVRVTTGWITARDSARVLADRQIATDLERVWDHFQSRALSSLYDYVMALEEGQPRPERAPFFGELTVDVNLSEPDYELGLDRERISSLDALHEDLYFGTLHFFDVLGRYTRGQPLNYPGRVLPIMRPKSDGGPGLVKIRLTGFGSSRPSVAIDYVEQDGGSGTLALDVPKVAVDRPSAVGAAVKGGEQGIAELTLRLKVDTERDEREALVRRARADRVDAQMMSAEQVAAVVGNLSALRAAGLYRDALAYHDLGTLRVVAHWEHDAAPETQRTVRLEPNGTPPAVPDVRDLVPPAYRYAGETLVQWDTPIPPREAYETLGKMAASFPEATAYKLGSSYLGQDVWAMDLMPPMRATHWSQFKATALKPTVVYSARQHANEVSSTSHTLKLAELLLTDPKYRSALRRVNVVFHPITNPDGAQVAYDLYGLTPDYMLHAGYLGALGVDVTNGQWEQDPIYPESSIRADIWRTWLPDIFLNPHGYPHHEWVMVFSEYAGWVRNRVTESRDWWGTRGWFTPGFSYVDDPRHPRHKDAAFRIREMFTQNINAVPEVRAMNERAYDRYRRFGYAFDDQAFKLDFTNDVLVYTALKGVKASPTSPDFMTRNPNVTIWTGGTEAPDETAHGDWLKLVATAGLEWDKAILQYLLEGDHQIERKREAIHGGVSLSFSRPRPPKAKADAAS